MLGLTHAATGAAVWQLGCLVAVTEGHPPGVHVMVVGTALCAFGAVLPDIDMEKANVSTSLGPVTRWLSRAVARVCLVVHWLTRTDRDEPSETGHRTLTHTLVFCAAATVGFGALGRYGGLWAPLAVVFWAASTAIRALLPAGRRSFSLGRWFSRRAAGLERVARFTSRAEMPLGARRLRELAKVCKRLAWGTGLIHVPIAPGGGLVVAAAMWLWPAPSGWWLGFAVGAGCLVHCLGDAMTWKGVPLLWPVPVRGRTWHAVRPRPQWRFVTGGRRAGGEAARPDGGYDIRQARPPRDRGMVGREDRVEEYVLGYAVLVTVGAAAAVLYLSWWPAVLTWVSAVQAG
ncbi:metal-dependent hydrolase [Actinoplanes sp. URMC 104]|uniref:metal-dependent hydrolase n=1 Tax=Actinoplanes sp. URMC 104 TaxID=3423409 RepID=UPI003F1CEEE4